MRIKLKMNPQGQVYLPKIIREGTFEGEKEFEFYPNYFGGVLVPKGTDPEKILASLQSLENQIEEIKEAQNSE